MCKILSVELNLAKCGQKKPNITRLIIYLVIINMQLSLYGVSAVESHKGINVVQRSSAGNQKGAITVQSLWHYHPSGSQQNII